MTASTFLTADVLIAYSAYFVGTASPGPSNLAIMSLAMSAGRKSALTFALGVVSGSFFWALLASLGLSAVLASYSECLVAIKIAGGLYLLWLGFKSARSAFSAGALPANTVRQDEPLGRLYLRGLLLHLTNPKAILVWLSIVSLAMAPGGGASHVSHTAPVVLGCMCIGVSVFSSYAVLFSTASARRVYVAIRRWLDGSLAIMFGIAGIKLLTSKN
ncbi:threonine/homoserine/homoserine lactone efflux protein [Paraburkholderia terricola]|jgi:threonine efflux protein|uniref:Threonine/homoserine/homoserine lactone efflux protein n=1 Tax=Paraburkholderia terricola TaxID=169427 RepID=A0ABU1LJQ5_9BURK|nr:LysE family translocator [Paraburkholderia terricola]ORC51527.1 lysine transporter LysE [Burkholderia sp. A27]AXE95999.1 LysE family translocator [Paraburkholderia terricola]MDR6406961.1 threonine/homoserine/homoserine lactone efflux protein [Paraburkholderia terricola]MDR6479360.1 threonine/homoserine/homoserine lactone efflux protein [Paraburkholderia terricola]MDR6490377.1 threonine/homoserine/homoserine lactone efflux protein [Paraburkholderia terricola]